MVDSLITTRHNDVIWDLSHLISLNCESLLVTCTVLAVCCLLSAVCCLLSAVCCLLSAVCCLLCAVCRLLSAVCCLLSAVCCLLSAVCCLLSAVCCLLSAVCCLLSAGRDGQNDLFNSTVGFGFYAFFASFAHPPTAAAPCRSPSAFSCLLLAAPWLFHLNPKLTLKLKKAV
jgi:hypothetical protein